MTNDTDNKQKAIPLRERRDEILLLVRQYLKLAEEQLGTTSKELSKEAAAYILSYDWPGDENELEHAVKKACILCEGDILEIEDFDLKYRQPKSVGKFVESRLKGFMQKIKRLEEFNLYDMVIPEVERALILMVIKETKGNQVRAARLLGINRNTLRSKIRKLEIKVKP